jgi:hypothetical protein
LLNQVPRHGTSLLRLLIWGIAMPRVIADLADAKPPISHPPLSANDKDRLAKAYRFERNGWLYLHIEGTAEDRGFPARLPHGLRARGYSEIDAIRYDLEHGEDFEFLAKRAQGLYPSLVDPEIEGIAQGASKAGREPMPAKAH